MSTSIVTLSCVFAVLVQNVYGDCFPRNFYNVGSCGNGLAFNDYSLSYAGLGGACSDGYEAGLVPASDGGGFLVTSASPVPPSGVSVLSENEYSGIMAVAGQVPFLGTAYLEGSVPSAGAGAVTYGCGYGEVAIVSEEGTNSSPLVEASYARFPSAAAPRSNELGYNGWGACGCGRGILGY